MSGLGKEEFFTEMERQGLALTYDDVRLRTSAGNQQELPKEIDIASRFSREVELKTPFVSAAMDTVTEANMAIAMAKLGGVGVVHAAMSVEEQRATVRRVKKEVHGLIEQPICVQEDQTLEAVMNTAQDKGYKFTTFPVNDSNGLFVGLLTGNDFKYAEDFSSTTISDAMTPRENVITERPRIGLREAYAIMQEGKINTLPLIDEAGQIQGLYVFSDVKRIYMESEGYNTDAEGQLVTAAAVTTGRDAVDRVAELKKYLDVVVLDTADGDSFYALQTLRDLKEEFSDLDVVVGNISDGDSARILAENGADGIKVGQGPGSICTTRTETGIGTPQVTAVHECAKALGDDFADVPICADGGIRNKGDIPIAFAAGAHSAMMGRMLAGTAEAPGEVFARNDGSKLKVYRGMGSLAALRANEASRERYGADNDGPVLTEGVESHIPYIGPVEEVIGLCIAALRKSMRYVKAPNITYHRQHTKLMRITNAGLTESQTHDVNVVSR